MPQLITEEMVADLEREAEQLDDLWKHPDLAREAGVFVTVHDVINAKAKAARLREQIGQPIDT